MSDTYTKKNVPHCPNCNSQRVHHVSKWLWLSIWICFSLVLLIVYVGLVLLALTPLLWWLIPSYWMCRNCKTTTKDKQMVFKDLELPRVQGNDSRFFNR